MQPFQERVVEEKKQLDYKLQALHAFMVGDQLLELPVEERDRLVRQEGIMEQYSTVLGERIAAFSS